MFPRIRNVHNISIYFGAFRILASLRTGVVTAGRTTRAIDDIRRYENHEFTQAANIGVSREFWCFA